MSSKDDDINEFLDGLLNSDKGSKVESKIDSIEEDREDTQNEDYEEEKYLFTISDEMLEESDCDIPLEKYITEEEKADDGFAEGEDEDGSENGDGSEGGEEGSEEGDDEGDTEEGNDEKSEDDDLKGLMGDESDDDGILDVNDPDLKGYQSNSDMVSFDELSEKKDDDEGEFTSQEGKQKFEDLQKNGRKKVFEPGKLNKNNMIMFICAFLGLVMLGFYIATRDKDKKEKLLKDEENVNINDYNPDFGDYQNRAYKEEKNGEEENDEAYEKIEKILYEGEKEEFKKEEVPQYTQSYSTGNQQVQQVPQEDEYTKRVESSIRKGVLPKEYGYTGGTNGNGSGDMYGMPSNYGYPSVPGYQGQGGYFDQLGQITDSLNSSRGINQQGNVNYQSQALRYSDGGRYIRDKAGGDISSIPPNSIYPGYIIPAVLVSGINTDYPGDITARVTSNVYDSRTGSVLLIPAGSILRGSYSSSSIGISRIQIAWQSLIINRDGMDYYVNLGSMVGVDSRGYSGIAGTINDHYFEYLKAAGLACLFTYINSSVYSVSKAQKNRNTAQMIDTSQEIGNKLADKLLDRSLDIAPTVTVKGGTRINVDVNRILTLQPYERDMPKSRYRR